MKKVALITGITSQDGYYLSKLLLSKGYEVHGTIRPVSLEDPSRRLWRLDSIADRIILHTISLESFPSIFRLFNEVQPAECYHLAATSFVGYSLEDEFTTIATNINSTHYFLSALRHAVPQCKFYFAGSSEMFGKAPESPQSESTPFNPRSAYGISKVAGYQIMNYYREVYGLQTSCGFMFNHESPKRGYEFVTRKISFTAAQIKLGMAEKIHLGNVQAKRDWGFAGDYVEAMWLMLQKEEPSDYVIATGEVHTVAEFAEIAFNKLGLNFWQYLEVDEKLYRPSEDYILSGDCSKARREIQWEPKLHFDDLIKMMVDRDYYSLSGNHIEY